MPPENSPPRLVQFYDPILNAPDDEGRTLSSILSWSDSKLEYCHDYIQQIFPLPERSPINPSAPTISRQIFAAFRQRADLRGRLRQSFTRILAFYGLEQRLAAAASGRIEDVVLTIVKAQNFDKASKRWVTQFDHNHLRITRIIRCLRVLGLEQEAYAFYFQLKSVCEAWGGMISQKSFTFWTRAARRPLWLAPEKEDSEDARQGFLWEFEEGRKNEGIVDEPEVKGEDSDLAEAFKSKTGGTDKVLKMKKYTEDDGLADAQSSSSQEHTLETSVKSKDTSLMKASKSNTNGTDKALGMKESSEDYALTEAQGSISQESTLETSRGSKRKFDNVYNTP